MKDLKKVLRLLTERKMEMIDVLPKQDICNLLMELPAMNTKWLNPETTSYYMMRWLKVRTRKIKNKQIQERKDKITHQQEREKEKEFFDFYVQQRCADGIDISDHLSTMLYFSLYNELYKKIERKEKDGIVVYPSQVQKMEEALTRKHKKAMAQIIQLEMEDEKIKIEDFFFEFPYADFYVGKNKLSIVDDLLTLELPLVGELPRKEIILDILRFGKRFENEKDEALLKGFTTLGVMPSYHIPYVSKGQYIDIQLMMSGGNEVIRYAPSEKKIYRLDGQEIFTLEGLFYELKEIIGRRNEKTKERLNTAYEMFASTLSESQENMLRKEGFVLLEGEEYFYFASAQTTNTYLCRFPKTGEIKQNAIEKMKALCIHPTAAVPVYDGLAAINLHLVSGEEEYITQNSNAFSLRGKLKEQVEGFFENLKQKNIEFQGMQSLEALY